MHLLTGGDILMPETINKLKVNSMKRRTEVTNQLSPCRTWKPENKQDGQQLQTKQDWKYLRLLCFPLLVQRRLPFFTRSTVWKGPTPDCVLVFFSFGSNNQRLPIVWSAGTNRESTVKVNPWKLIPSRVTDVLFEMIVSLSEVNSFPTRSYLWEYSITMRVEHPVSWAIAAC